MNQEWKEWREKIEEAGWKSPNQSNSASEKWSVRKRIEALVGETFVEDGWNANLLDDKLPADGVVTGMGKIGDQKVCIIANDPKVKAGSWGEKTVEKMIRLQETAERLKLPIFYLIDSGGARITDQLKMFPNRRGAGKIFHQQINLSGYVPQICVLFGPSAAGGAYIPAFCDIVIMIEGNASMYLGSPRMAEKVIGEKVSLEEMGGARMHCTISGCGDVLAQNEEEGIELAKKYVTLLASLKTSGLPPKVGERKLSEIIPNHEHAPFCMYQFIDGLVDEDSFFELKKLFAPEVITGFARIDGRLVGIIANQPKVKGGVLFVDSADKGARFMQLCDAYSVPMLFLADIPGFMIGSQVEKSGIIRHGAKWIAAMSSANVPKISVIVRKAYGAGLYAMAGPAFEPDCCIALPSAKTAVMGPEAAVQAVFAKKIESIIDPSERIDFVQQEINKYREDVSLERVADEMIIDDVVQPDDLRDSLIKRFAFYETSNRKRLEKKRMIFPV
ncbi:acyl-CoA carboxylase subunit beta [Mangrovibacillus cuniculi]|uniref:Acyl-CoA carboxylase subunit beta n=1 Tax=Mangrovibacillus cuniculi TaxID=2593652 RepID=A0A7S8CA79_9BACI|nr:acyl-CoA carboxylase subunit beta [Mangrovibacillus cuniculi]QPC46245.1 acyl-CoA carboxylase subunit beta [Mangrovibacillus cuniculi]